MIAERLFVIRMPQIFTLSSVSFEDVIRYTWVASVSRIALCLHFYQILSRFVGILIFMLELSGSFYSQHITGIGPWNRKCWHSTSSQKRSLSTSSRKHCHSNFVTIFCNCSRVLCHRTMCMFWSWGIEAAWVDSVVSPARSERVNADIPSNWDKCGKCWD